MMVLSLYLLLSSMFNDTEMVVETQILVNLLEQLIAMVKLFYDLESMIGMLGSCLHGKEEDNSQNISKYIGREHIDLSICIFLSSPTSKLDGRQL